MKTPIVSDGAIRIRMLRTVRPDGLLGLKGTTLERGAEYVATSNRLGAVSGWSDNGERLGVKPGEFEFVKAPQWLLAIHEKIG